MVWAYFTCSAVRFSSWLSASNLGQNQGRVQRRGRHSSWGHIGQKVGICTGWPAPLHGLELIRFIAFSKVIALALQLLGLALPTGSLVCSSSTWLAAPGAPGNSSAAALLFHSHWIPATSALNCSSSALALGFRQQAYVIEYGIRRADRRQQWCLRNARNERILIAHRG